MSIRIHEPDLEELQWLMRREYEGQMGCRSNACSTLDTLERGSTGASSALSGDVSERAFHAAARLRHALTRLRRCNELEQAMLSAAFGEGSSEGLGAYGDFPRAVLACPEAVALKEELGDPRPVGIFLLSLANIARKGRGKHQQRAITYVHQLREAAETRLVGALASYGARVEGVETPAFLSLRQLSEALGVRRETMRHELALRGLVSAPSGRGTALRISIRELQACWPEAGRAIVQRAVEARG